MVHQYASWSLMIRGDDTCGWCLFCMHVVSIIVAVCCQCMFMMRFHNTWWYPCEWCMLMMFAHNAWSLCLLMMINDDGCSWHASCLWCMMIMIIMHDSDACWWCIMHDYDACSWCIMILDAWWLMHNAWWSEFMQHS